MSSFFSRPVPKLNQVVFLAEMYNIVSIYGQDEKTGEEYRGLICRGVEEVGKVHYGGWEFADGTSRDSLWDEVLGMDEDSRGRIWFATALGVDCYLLDHPISNPIF